jgi:hypothetical protein
MATDAHHRLERRVTSAAEAALARQQHVSAIDVLLGLGWLQPVHLQAWRQGRVPDLEQIVQVNPSKLSTALRLFQRWAREQGLRASETAYVARTRDRRSLRFSKGGDPAIEQAYRTSWVSPAVSQRQQDRLTERASKPPDLVVIAPLSDFTCHACGGGGDLLIMEDRGALCLTCADLDHLVFLPAGNATLTRRARAASSLSAVVVRWSRSRKRYERQGSLVEERALEAAETACLADADARARRRERDEARRERDDAQLQERIAEGILALLPSCPPERADAIARHTATRGSGRVGRTAAAKALDADTLLRAAAASVRHEDTDYDDLLMAGTAREDARDRVRDDVSAVLERWRQPRG